MTINLNDVKFDLNLQFYVNDKRVEKIKLNKDGELVFIISELKYDEYDQHGYGISGRWDDVEYSAEQVSLRTQPKKDDVWD